MNSLIPIAKRWKQRQYLLRDVQVKKIESISAMKYASAIKRKESLTDGATWMNFEDMLLSEISQAPKDACCMISLLGGIERSQTHRSRK